MSRKSILIAALLACLAVIGWAVYAQKPSAGRVQWEYKMVFVPDESSEDASLKIINGLGAEGWEVIEFHQRGIDTLSGQYLFKRQK